jgi:hypothetical protein
MDNYQFYLLDRKGCTAGPPRVEPFKDDEAALTEARKTLDAQTIEIWQGEPCVATLLQKQRSPEFDSALVPNPPLRRFAISRECI